MEKKEKQEKFYLKKLLRNFLIVVLTDILLLYLMYQLWGNIANMILVSIVLLFLSVSKEHSFALKEWRENEIRYNSIIDSKKIEIEKENKL